MKIDLKQTVPPAPPPPKRYALNLELDYTELCLLCRIFGRVGGGIPGDIVADLYREIAQIDPSVEYDAREFVLNHGEDTLRFQNAASVMSKLRANNP